MGQPAPPTWFANAAHAWEVLPDDLRQRVADLHAVQVTGPEYIHERRREAFDGELIQGRRENPPSAVTPVAYVHPRTGRTFLSVMQGMTRNIAELSWEESEDLLEELFAYLYHPEAIYAHEWREGDLVLWDNLFIQHGRPNVSTSGPPRTLQKIGLPMPTDVSAHLIDSYEDVVS